MDIPEKYSGVKRLVHYPLGQLLRMTLTASGKTCFGKILQPPDTLPEELIHDLIKTLEEETNLLKNSPNEAILPSLATEKGKGSLLATFEYPDLPSLAQYLRENHPLPLSTVMDLLDQLAEIFSVLFNLGIHRFQIEPDILPIQPRDHTLKYLDTGLVNLAKYPDLLRLGYLDGKPQFLPPELLRAGELGAASEVYLFAIFTYFLLTGRLPYANYPPAAIAALSVSENPPPLNRFKGASEMDSNKLIARAGEKDPSKRLSSLCEFLDELRAIFQAGDK